MYSATTEDIEVTVDPQFLEEHSDPLEGRFVWAYTIEIRNRSGDTVRLRKRHWRITDGGGHVEEVQGQGVIGEQPLIPPGGAFGYTSGCPLTTPSGIMVGEYEMERPDGSRFRVNIPAFSLDLPGAIHALN